MPANGFVFSRWWRPAAAHWRLSLVGCLVLAACSGKTTKSELPLPTGHFEGPVTIQGTELRAALDLREVTPGKLQAELSFPAVPGVEVPLNEIRYAEPQLQFEEDGGFPGHVTVNAVREGDFLRGAFLLDSLRAEFVWVRRGQAVSRGYQAQTFKLPASAATLYMPQDTAAQHPVLILLPDSATTAGMPARAAWLARQGVASLVLPVPQFARNPADSSARQTVQAAFARLRHTPGLDSAKIGVWVRGYAGTQVVSGLAAQRPAAVVLEGISLPQPADAKPFKELSRQRLPTLGLYAAADQPANSRESARRLRTAIGYGRGNAVYVYADANRYFLVPGRTSSAGVWSWPRFAPNYAENVSQWLAQRLKK